MAVAETNLDLAEDLEVIEHNLDVRGRFLIDAGCGEMHLSRALAKLGASVLGIDPDPVQARKNREAPITPNLGFVESGADALPVEPHSVNGVFFFNYLHHIPSSLYPAVFSELLRVLRPDGFVYVLEPVAAGDLNEVMRLFHDESRVRADAQLALEQLAMPMFGKVRIINYRTPVPYASWEYYAARYAGKSFNPHYTEADVRAEPVRQRFLELGSNNGLRFEALKKVTWLAQPKKLASA